MGVEGKSILNNQGKFHVGSLLQNDDLEAVSNHRSHQHGHHSSAHEVDAMSQTSNNGNPVDQRNEVAIRISKINIAINEGQK